MHAHAQQLVDDVADDLDRWLDGKNHRRLELVSGLSRSQLYAWQSGQFPLPCYAAPRIYRAVPDVASFANVMGLADVGLQLSRVPAAVRSVDDLRDAALHVAAQAGELAALVSKALADGMLDERERRELVAASNKVERAAEEMRAATVSTASAQPRSAPLGCLRADRSRPR